MHEVFAFYTNVPAIFYDLGMDAVTILLWFWVISGALFGLRFLAYFLLDRKSAPQRPLAAAATLIQFPIERFRKKHRGDESAE